MRLDKTNVCVLIESQAQLQQAREVLERYGESCNFIWVENDNNILCLSGSTIWGVYGYKLDHETKITLTELEEILKPKVDTENFIPMLLIHNNTEVLKIDSEGNLFLNGKNVGNEPKLVEILKGEKDE